MADSKPPAAAPTFIAGGVPPISLEVLQQKPMRDWSDGEVANWLEQVAGGAFKAKAASFAGLSGMLFAPLTEAQIKEEVKGPLGSALFNTKKEWLEKQATSGPPPSPPGDPPGPQQQPSDAVKMLQEDFTRFKLASEAKQRETEAKQRETEAKLAEVETQLRVMSAWSTSKSYANIYAEWQRACPNLLPFNEFLQKTGVQMSPDSLTEEAWQACKPNLPSLSAPESTYQTHLENVLKGLLKHRTWPDLKPFYKCSLGEDERRIPDAFFLIRTSGETPSWLTVCLPLELENGEESKKNEGRGQACAYLSQMAKQRIAARQAEYIRGISIFTNLHVISFMFTERNPADGAITQLMTAEFPLFASQTVTQGFQALLSLLMAPLHLLVSPITTPPKEGVTSLMYAANGTEIWRHPTEDAIIKVAITSEKRQQLAHEFAVLSRLPDLGWKATIFQPSMITISPRGHRSLKGHICSATLAAHYMRQLVAQVKIAHLAGFVHCDIRPSNVIMFDGDTVRLGDWGNSGELKDGIYSANPVGVICWLSDGAVANAKRSATYDYSIYDDLESLALIYCFMLGTATEPPWQRTSAAAMLQVRAKSMSLSHLASTEFLRIVREKPDAVHDKLLTFLNKL